MSRNPIKRRGFLNFGFSTILIAFVMISIITFCTLSLLTANSDYQLSRKVAEKSTGYYHAEEEAYRILSEMDELLSEAYTEHRSEDAYYPEAYRVLSAYAKDSPLPVTVTEEGASFTIAVSDSQQLYVEIRITFPPASGGTFYELTQWKTITEISADDDATLHLIGT